MRLRDVLLYHMGQELHLEKPEMVNAINSQTQKIRDLVIEGTRREYLTRVHRLVSRPQRACYLSNLSLQLSSTFPVS